MSSLMSSTRTIISNATNKHTATLLFLHGSGSCGSDIEEWISSLMPPKFTFPHIKIIYPTAPLQPYTPLHGAPSNVWFDRSAVAIGAPEIKSSIDSACESISALIDEEVSNGIPIGRIVIGGFSMGGALSLHSAYRYKKSLAGCCVMSSFLNKNSLVYEALKGENASNVPPLLQFHGKDDDLVPLKWGVTTHNLLKSFKVDGEMRILDGVGHELVKSEMEHLKKWLLDIVPDT